MTRTRVVAGLVGSLLALVGCSGGEGPSRGPGDRSGSAASVATDRPDARTTPVVGAVVGRLEPTARRQVAHRVAEVVDTWWDAAFLDRDYPGPGGAPAYRRSFPGFTATAAAAAQRQRATTSSAAWAGRVTDVRAVRRKVAVDVLATGGTPRAVTARVRMDLQTYGGSARRLRVQGRLRMTWDRGWKVFAFDLQQGPKPEGER